MMESWLGVIFMFYGFGYFLGFDIYDIGGYFVGIEWINLLGLKFLWIVWILEEGMVVIVEFGCYFIEVFLVFVLEDFV